jgi:hypothetical protein
MNEYIFVLPPIVLVMAYCGMQCVRNFRERRYLSGAAGVISVLIASFWLFTMAYNAALTADRISPVRVIVEPVAR